MSNAIKYKVNVCEKGMEIKSMTRLGDDLVGVVLEDDRYASILKVLRLSDGQILWETKLEEAVHGGTRPIYDSQNIYVPYGNARLTANDPQNGAVRWKAPISTLLCSPLAQTAKHIMELNSDNSNYRIIDKANGAIVSKGKFKHKHARYIQNVHPWGENFLAIGESRGKPVLGVYAPDSFIQNMAAAGDLSDLEYEWVSDDLYYQRAAARVVGDHLYFTTLIGNVGQFNLKTGEFKNIFSLNPNLDIAALEKASGILNDLTSIYHYSNMVVLDDCLYWSVFEFQPKSSPAIRKVCMIDLKTGVCTTKPDQSVSDLILEDGTSVALSDEGFVIDSLTNNAAAITIALEGWEEVSKSRKYLEYGDHWIVADNQLLIMPANGGEATGELHCWEF